MIAFKMNFRIVIFKIIKKNEYMVIDQPHRPQSILIQQNAIGRNPLLVMHKRTLNQYLTASYPPPIYLASFRDEMSS